VSVKDFGAVGDGVTDDIDAINDAIAYAKATSGVKAVYFPTGNYRITSSIDARGDFGTGIELWGSRATITSTGDFPALRLNGRVPDTPPEVRMMVYVHGFVFQGPGKANTSSIGIEAQRGANVRVKD
jgi:polygalacturonase